VSFRKHSALRKDQRRQREEDPGPSHYISSDCMRTERIAAELGSTEAIEWIAAPEVSKGSEESPVGKYRGRLGAKRNGESGLRAANAFRAIATPINMLRDRGEEPSVPSFPYSYPSTWASQSTQVGQLVMRAMALLESDRASALRCLRAASALVAEVTGSVERETPALQVRWRGGLAAWQVNRVLRYIEGNLGARVVLADMAGCVALSKSHFSRAFKRSVGSSPNAYVVGRRVERAKLIMTSTRQSLTDIALACGFSDHSHFTKCFRRVVGMSPRGWRRAAIHWAD
jgi:AraC family transcriptional regulator